MQGVSFPDFTDFSADAFYEPGSISLSCQIIWTDPTCLTSLLACILCLFTQLSIPLANWWTQIQAISLDARAAK
jgi:hypothetical protein